MTYRRALQTVIGHLFHIIIFPSWLLHITPSRSARLLRTAHAEAMAYLEDLMLQKEHELHVYRETLGTNRHTDIMSSLVVARDEQRANPRINASESKAREEDEALTDKAIMSNVFLMLIAGHETTATTLLLILVELALNPEWQREVQADIDRVFGQRQHDAWNVREDAIKLWNSKVGATINEVLRLYPPVNIIPKGTNAYSPQTVSKGQREFTVRGNTAIQLLVVSTHHNSRYWPSGSPCDEKFALDQFYTRRWLSKPGNNDFILKSGDFETKLGLEQKLDVVRDLQRAELFRPYPGAFIAFSIGARGCLGRCFAETELLAVIAVLLKDHSLELGVEEIINTTVTVKPNSRELRVAYEEAKAEVRRMVRGGISHHLTMQFSGRTYLSG